MARVLSDLPAGIALKAPSRRSETNRPLPKGQARGGVPKTAESLYRLPGGFINSKEGSEWLIRRTDEFGVASSRYFKKTGTCPKPVK